MLPIAPEQRATLALLEALFLQIGSVMLIALATMWLARRLPAMRLVVGRVSLLAVVGLIAWTALVPSAKPWAKPVVAVDWYPPVTQPETRHAMLSRPPASHSRWSGVTTQPPPALTAPFMSAPQPTFDLLLAIKAVWLGGIAILLAHLAFGYGVICRVRRTSTPIPDESMLANLAAVARNAGVRAPQLRENAQVTGPVVTGILRPVILLPSGFAEGILPDELTAVLRHEVAHIANRDLHWTLFYRLLAIAVWPQPLIRLLARPMEAACEELCDREVVLSGISTSVYAACLLRLREEAERRRSPSCGIGVINKPRQIATRIEAVLENRQIRTRIARPMFAVLVLSVGLAAYAVTGVFAATGRGSGGDRLGLANRQSGKLIGGFSGTGLHSDETRGGDAATGTRTSSLLGTWVRTSDVVEASDPLPGSVHVANEPEQSVQFVVQRFLADGRFEEETVFNGSSPADAIVKGTYKLDGNDLVIDTPRSRGFATTHRTLMVDTSGSTLTERDPSGGRTSTLVKLNPNHLPTMANGDLTRPGVWRSADGELLALRSVGGFRLAVPLRGADPGGAVRVISKGAYGSYHGYLLVYNLSSMFEAHAGKTKSTKSVMLATAQATAPSTIKFDDSSDFPQLSGRSFRRDDSYPAIPPFHERLARPLFGKWLVDKGYTWEFKPDGTSTRITRYAIDQFQRQPGHYSFDGHLLMMSESDYMDASPHLVFAAVVSDLTSNSLRFGNAKKLHLQVLQSDAYDTLDAVVHRVQ